MRHHSPNEVQLKAAVIDRLIKSGMAATTILINELPLGRTSVRADLVAVSPRDQICGIEVKSDRDSLVRLERQINVYRTYFDRTVLVVGERHLSRALELDLPDVEIWAARNNRDIEVVRQASQRIIPKTGVELLTQTQARRAHGDERSSYCAALRERFSDTSHTFFAMTAGRDVLPEDLRHLSRFEQIRSNVAKAKEHRTSLLNEWASFFANQRSVHSSSVS